MKSHRMPFGFQMAGFAVLVTIILILWFIIIFAL